MLVSESEKCKTCKYRGLLNQQTPFCQYSLFKEELRDCSVEKCDKYEKRGRRRRKEIYFGAYENKFR